MSRPTSGMARRGIRPGILSGSGCAGWGSWSSPCGARVGFAKCSSYSRLVWLGKISYGLYMYHEIAMWLRERVGNFLGWFPNKEELLTIGTLALTIGLAAASYYGYERRFLELKRGWTRVPSRPV